MPHWIRAGGTGDEIFSLLLSLRSLLYLLRLLDTLKVGSLPFRGYLSGGDANCHVAKARKDPEAHISCANDLSTLRTSLVQPTIYQLGMTRLTLYLDGRRVVCRNHRTSTG